ncbi:JmjC domain-containing protein [Kitasatospora sp. NPDC004240]
MDGQQRTPLGGLVDDPETFWRDVWRRRPLLMTPTAPPTDVFRLADLDDLIDCGQLRHPYGRLWQFGVDLPAAGYTVSRRVVDQWEPGYLDPLAVRRGLAAGRTLLLAQVNEWHPPVARLAARLRAELGRAVEAFVFLTPPGRQALPTHRDDADVLVLQLYGSKSWRVHGGPADGHWEPDACPRPGPVLLETTIEPGQVLYLPRGFAHRAVGEHGLSLHLSLTLREIGSRQLHQEAGRLLAEAWSGPVRPLDEAGLEEAAAELLARYAARLAALDPAELVARARRSTVRAQEGEPRPSFTALALPGEPDPKQK